MIFGAKSPSRDPLQVGSVDGSVGEAASDPWALQMAYEIIVSTYTHLCIYIYSMYIGRDHQCNYLHMCVYIYILWITDKMFGRQE